MKRSFSLIFLCLLLLLWLALPVSAAYPPVMDTAMVLTDQEQSDLQLQSLAIRQELGIDAAVCITDSLGGRSAQAFADDWYDSHNYSPDGLLFLLAMEEREWHISTAGRAISLISDRDLDQVEDRVIPCFSRGDYYEGFSLFFSMVPSLAEGSEEAGPQVNFLLSLGIGAAVAAVSLLVMRSCMNTKKPQHGAASYEAENSYHLRQHQDLFLYSNISKVRRQENNSSTTHRSSSGRSHGGRGGSF